eukprot:TRINITY_DN9130_c0_g1_i1.p1 TRINITY_DN9130_c0_g1~~TRINITY_DN9130_c0_g1_i1.p1  ORF type:complete len:203 (-),score=24.13 TRINITY_DN9130_c0_g1_i1:109-687(-)
MAAAFKPAFLSSAVLSDTKFGGSGALQRRLECPSLQKVSRASLSFRLLNVRCCSPETTFSSPKTGAVGEARFKDHSASGTYWGPKIEGGQSVTVRFDLGTEVIEEQAHVGENMLRVAERCGAMLPNQDFCYEGTCCHCEMDVEGGATEVGYRANASGEDLIRSCICPVPVRQQEQVVVRILSEEDAWGSGVL